MHRHEFDGLPALASAVHAARSAERVLPIWEAAVARGEVPVVHASLVRIALDAAFAARAAAAAAAAAAEVGDPDDPIAEHRAAAGAEGATSAAGDAGFAALGHDSAAGNAASAAVAAASAAAVAARAAATGVPVHYEAAPAEAAEAADLAVAAADYARTAIAFIDDTVTRVAIAAFDAVAVADLVKLSIQTQAEAIFHGTLTDIEHPLGPKWPDGEPECFARLGEPAGDASSDRETEQDNDVDPNMLVLRAVIDRGNATPEQVGGVLGRISNIYRALGFEGVDFSLEYEHEYVDAEVPQ